MPGLEGRGVSLWQDTRCAKRPAGRTRAFARSRTRGPRCQAARKRLCEMHGKEGCKASQDNHETLVPRCGRLIPAAGRRRVDDTSLAISASSHCRNALRRWRRRRWHPVGTRQTCFGCFRTGQRPGSVPAGSRFVRSIGRMISRTDRSTVIESRRRIPPCALQGVVSSHQCGPRGPYRWRLNLCIVFLL